MESALKKIGRSAGFSFSYKSSLIEEKEIVSFQGANRSVREILDQLFKGEIAYKERGTHLILIKAEKENKTPAEYVQYWNRRDHDDFASLGISFDLFYKTSSKENLEFVQEVFQKLSKNGHIYDQSVIQFYCTYDDKFLPDRYVIGKCPNCGAENQYSDLCEKCGRVPDQILDPKCAICGRPPVKRESKHYFFRLSSFGQKLKDWLNSNAHLQSDVRNYVVNWIDEGLQDWDITRDLSWGVPIPLPEAKGKVFWFWSIRWPLVGI